MAKLQSAPADWLTRASSDELEIPKKYVPTYYFFYGTLMKPEKVQHILDLHQSPTLHPAKIKGYALAQWGDYKTLINGPRGNVINGMAYLVESEEDERKLVYYETKAYDVKPCLITFDNGPDRDTETIYGRTFKYAGDAEALKAGRFDRKLWAKQMGLSTPSMWDPSAKGYRQFTGFVRQMRTKEPEANNSHGDLTPGN